MQVVYVLCKRQEAGRLHVDAVKGREIRAEIQLWEACTDGSKGSAGQKAVAFVVHLPREASSASALGKGQSGEKVKVRWEKVNS